MSKLELRTFPDAPTLAQTAARDWLARIAAAHRARTRHLVALSGGRIAKLFLAATADRAESAGVSLEPVHFFWADERCVPPDDAASNFRLAHDLLLGPLGVKAAQVHRIRGEAAPALAAAEAEAAIRGVAPMDAAGFPVLDLIFLGMGEDGHVASLFPDELPAQARADWIYHPVTSPKPPPRRITLGYRPIAAAREVWVLASGQGKEAALGESLAASGWTPLAEVVRQRSATRLYTDIPMPGPASGGGTGEKFAGRV